MSSRFNKEAADTMGCVGCVVWILAAIFLWWVLFDNGFYHIVNAFNKIGS